MHNENMTMFALGMKVGGALAAISFIKEHVSKMESSSISIDAREEIIRGIDEIIASLK